MSAYIFILCPPYSGSTLLWKLVSTSKAVSALPDEGQRLPEVHDIMRHGCWSADHSLPWAYIKTVWDGYWDQTKPLLIEKSPPNIIRTADILEHFSPVYFLIMVRNPYAHCEGLIRRNRWSATRAAQFAVRCLRQQTMNVEALPNALRLTYEALVGNPEAVSRQIQAFIPRLGALDYTRRFTINSIDRVDERAIVDLNKKKIAHLTPWQIGAINEVLRDAAADMAFWGYEYYEPTWKHLFSCAGTRTALLSARIVAKGKSLVESLGRFY